MRWFGLALLALLSIYFLWNRHKARSRAVVLKRLRKHLGPADPGGRGGSRVHRLASVLGEKFDATRYGRRLRGALDISGMRIEWTRFRLIVLFGALFFVALAAVVTENPLSVPLAAISAVFVPFPFLRVIRRHNARKRAEEVEQFASDLALYLMCGTPIEDAVGLCSGDPRGAVYEPIETFSRQVALGGGTEGPLNELVETLRNPDLLLIAHAVLTSRDTGSDVKNIMAAVGEAIRERSAIRRELHTQTIQGRISGRVVAGLPLLFLGLSLFVSRGSVDTLFGTVPGLLMLSIATVLNAVGFLWIRKILDIET